MQAEALHQVRLSLSNYQDDERSNKLKIDNKHLIVASCWFSLSLFKQTDRQTDRQLQNQVHFPRVVMQITHRDGKTGVTHP
jgi:hypothetical protein